MSEESHKPEAESQKQEAESDKGLITASGLLLMAEFEGCYVKLDDGPTYWMVENGERIPIHSTEEMYAHGLRPVVTISLQELRSIPLRRARKGKKK